MKLTSNKRIYLDYASLTPIDPRVIREMKRYSGARYANPSSLYAEGVAAKKALEDARARVAGFLGAHSDEIIFTSGGTESNGLAIEGVLRAARMNGIERPHLIMSAIEHASAIEVAHMIETVGGDVTYISVAADGVIDLDALKKAIRPSTVLVSVMTVNNEIGTIQPIREIAKIIRQARTGGTGGVPSVGAAEKSAYPLFHTDAAQGALYSDLNVEKSGVDLLTLDGGKVFGPRGVGALYIRRGVAVKPILHGGGQERGLRSGTENVPAIMGFALALDIGVKMREKESVRIAQLREFFVKGLRGIFEEKNAGKVIVVRGEISGAASHSTSVAPHILNVSIPGIDNEFFILQLDAVGVACSTKSSCLRDADESYVLRAIGADSKTSVRFSFGRMTTLGELKKALKAIDGIAKSSL